MHGSKWNQGVHRRANHSGTPGEARPPILCIPACAARPKWVQQQAQPSRCVKAIAQIKICVVKRMHGHVLAVVAALQQGNNV